MNFEEARIILTKSFKFGFLGCEDECEDVVSNLMKEHKINNDNDIKNILIETYNLGFKGIMDQCEDVVENKLEKMFFKRKVFDIKKTLLDDDLRNELFYYASKNKLITYYDQSVTSNGNKFLEFRFIYAIINMKILTKYMSFDNGKIFFDNKGSITIEINHIYYSIDNEGIYKYVYGPEGLKKYVAKPQEGLFIKEN